MKNIYHNRQLIKKLLEVQVGGDTDATKFFLRQGGLTLRLTQFII